MNTTEIRALVAQKIAGQGMMVDAGASLQPIVESLCNIIDAQAEQLANLKEYTAGLGISISEQGEISTPLVVDITGIEPGEQLTSATFNKLKHCVAVLYDGVVYPIFYGASTYIAATDSTVAFVFGSGITDDDQISEYDLIVIYDDGELQHEITG